MKYQKKPEIVEAEQFTGENNPFGVVVHDDFGVASIESGYWVIKQGNDNFDTLSDKDFKEQYMPVAETITIAEAERVWRESKR